MPKLHESDFFFKKNFDLDEGFYQNMQDFKSVKDFLKKRKVKKKKAFDNINLLKLAIDFYLDDQITPILNENGETTMTAGLFDIQNEPDNERLISELNYYQKEDYDPNVNKKEINSNLLDVLKIKDPSLLMVNDGIDSSELVSQQYNNLLSDNNDGTKVNINNLI